MFTSKLASVAGLIGAAVIAVAIGPGAAATAFAATPDNQITIRVSVDDLNLSSEAGAQAALARIHHAAQDICGDDGNRTSLAEQAKLRACIDSTVERAMAASNLPTLVAVSHGRPVTTAVASANR
jgi:UrcA family protein